MRESQKKKKTPPNSNPVKQHSARTQRRDTKALERTDNKVHNPKETESNVSHCKSVPTDVAVSDKSAGILPSDVYENGVVESELVGQDGAPASNHVSRGHPEVKEEHSDSETTLDSVSSQGDSLTADEEKSARPFEIHEKENIDSDENSADARSAARPVETQLSGELAKDSCHIVHSSSKLNVDKPTSREALNGDEHLASHDGLRPAQASSKPKDNNGVAGSENGTVTGSVDDDDDDDAEFPDRTSLTWKIEEIEARIEKLEEELREVAALEISLYTVVPEHGSSAHKVHTPARRLSRLYIHACKHWTQSRRATIARSMVSGLALVARTCGNDVSRLNFWLSNTVVLRETITQAFGSSAQPNVTRIALSNGGTKLAQGIHLSGNFKGSHANNKMNKGVTWFIEDWQDTGTFTYALEKVESWLFSRIVESVWWQALTPHMQSPLEELTTNKSVRRSSGSASGDQKQGSTSIDLWRAAFADAFHRLCPVRAGGHECGCLPVLARMVMTACVARLDVAMFNAVLRESEHEIPTDPVSDPIVDPTVLPIAAGELSFGSGVQLKNAVGNWSRCLHDLFGMDVGYPLDAHDGGSEDDRPQQNAHAEPEFFKLLDELSDLLMLPKDMLADRSVRREVCPSITLPLIKRIVCNFTPDEFCPDDVPGDVLEVLNAESVLERRLAGDSTGCFPYPASPVVYSRPSTADVAEKVAEAGGKPRLEHNVSSIQRKGYTSDEELEDLDSPLAYIVENLRSSVDASQLQCADVTLERIDHYDHGGVNARYKLLREVWSG